MPSLLHEILLEFFRNDPNLAPRLLRDAHGVSLPAFTAVEIRDSDLSQATPPEYRADLLLTLEGNGPELVIVVEAQLDRDAEKRLVWPAYAINARRARGCPACVVVICTDAAVARWCAAPIPIGPGNVFQVFVLGPAEIPRVTDPEVAKTSPELAVLSALIHQHSEAGVQISAAALRAAVGLDATRASLYYDLVVRGLSPAQRDSLEGHLMIEGYVYQTEFAKKHYGRGRAEGKAEGRAEGEARGEARGKAEGKATALLQLLRLRGLSTTPAQEQRVADCRDLETLDAWFVRAVTAERADEVFGD